jgi:hypothetical protein
MIKAKSAKAKGRRLEQWIVKQLESLGLAAHRQPGSGAFDAFPHDVSARLKDGTQILVEAKQRKKDAWATGERWLGRADVLVVRIDPEPFQPENEPRVYMKWSTFQRLVG